MKAECKKIVVETIEVKALLASTEDTGTVTGEVVSTGPQYPGAAVGGDIVVYSKTSGRRTIVNGKTYLTLNADEVCMILEEDDFPNKVETKKSDDED